MIFETRLDALVAEGRLSAEDAAALLADRARSGDVAIVGMALRVPRADDLRAFRSLLANRACVVEPFPEQRFRLVTEARPELAERFGQLRATAATDPRSPGGWLSGIEQFDAGAFGLSPYDAGFLGPAERLFLQTSAEALVQAGTPGPGLAGSRTGVFAAHTPEPPFEYLELFDEQDERAFLANIPGGLAYHLAYQYDLRGPVLTVNTTCSSSLVATHLARRSLAGGECDLAVVAGVSVNVFPFWDDQPEHIVRSPEFRCKPYDARADGIVYGEGVVVVVLKRLAEALADRDHVHAVIRGSAVGSDGSSNGMQAPNPDAQVAVVREALAEAGVSAADIGYVEGHGTGTRLGDLVEVDSLNRAYAQDGAAPASCRLGSIKGNLGHLGDAAGLAGLVNAVQAIERGAFAGQTGLREPSPLLPLDGSPFVVSGEPAPWPEPPGGAPRRAGVTSLGITGTNAHVVLEEAPRRENRDEAGVAVPVLLSAGSRQALWQLIPELAGWLTESAVRCTLTEVAHTYATRPRQAARVVVFATDLADLAGKLDRLGPVRTFERVPDALYAEGVFVADDEDSRAESLDRFDGYRGDASAGDLRAAAAFLAGEETGDELVGRFDGTHRVPAPVAPFTPRRIWPGTARDRVVDVDALMFAARWEPRPAPATGEGPHGLWLLYANQDDAVAEALEARLKELGNRVTVIVPGTRFAELGDDRFAVAPLDEASYREVRAALGAGVGELVGVVHATSLAPVERAAADLDAVERTQAAGVFSLFPLIQAFLAEPTPRRIRLGVLACGTEQVTGGERIEPGRVTAFGLAKVCSQENPMVSEIAVDDDLDGPPAEVADRLLAELTAADPLPLVAYRAGARFTKLVDRRPGLPERPRDLPVRAGGTYLLAGGTGYLGMQVGRYLSDRGAGTVVLLSRQGLRLDGDDPDATYRAEAVEAMRANGTSVESMRCDITDADALAKVFEDVRAAHGRVDGAFMMAKQLYHTWIRELAFEHFAAGVRNRVHGTWALARELRADPPDFLVLFSSISSLTGTKGAAECCAVNQFLDAAGPHLSESGVPTHVLNLTLILDDRAEFGNATPIPPLDFTEFRAALDRFFRAGRALDIVARLDLAEVHYLRDVLRIPLAPDVWAEARDHVAASTEADDSGGDVAPAPLGREEIRALLADLWHRALGEPEPGDDDNFFAAGGTSLSAIRMVHLIGKALPDAAVDVTRLYGNPSFGALVDLCARALGGPAEEEPDDLDRILDAVVAGRIDRAEATLRVGTALGEDRR